MIDQVRREIDRRFAQVRAAARGALAGLQLANRVQRGNVDALAGEQLQDVELLQHFGFTSAPPDGTQVIFIPLGGRTSASVIVATEHGAFRFKLDNLGESAVYNQWGDFVHLKKARTIHVKAQARVDVEAPEATFSGNVAIAGNLHVDGDITANGDVTPNAGV